MTTVQRLDSGGRLSRARRTATGGARVKARITRTGVFEYRLADGSVRRELRHPDEVFHPDSMATLEDVPVVDIQHHTRLLGPDDHRDTSLGHLKSYERDGKFIGSDLVILDGATLDAIDRGDRTEISCGYACRLEQASGVFEGERYDCIQREIRYNHIALCPPNRGRAGPEVALRLDAVSITTFDSDDAEKFDSFTWRMAVREEAARAAMRAAWLGERRLDATRAHATAKVGAVDDATRSVWVLASTTEAVDGEALVSWDLSRFEKNPVVLWSHNAAELPIGVAEEFAIDGEGLRLRIRFAMGMINPLAELVYQGVREGVIRAVSVGYDPGIATALKDGTVQRENNVLKELSFVAVGADENALVEIEETEEAIMEQEAKTDGYHDDYALGRAEGTALAREEKRQQASLEAAHAEAEAAYQRMLERSRNSWRTGWTQASTTPKTPARLDAGDEDIADRARREMIERHHNAWKQQPAAPTSTTSVHVDSEDDAGERARQAMIERHRNAWRQTA